MKEYKHPIHKKSKGKIKKIVIWQISTVILGVLLLISIFMGGLGKTSASTSYNLNGADVADKTVEFINENILQGQETAKLKEVEESNGMYKIKLDIGGQEMESYISNDGELLFPQAFDLTKTPKSQQSQEISQETKSTQVNLQKSDKPEVELFVMSHCPYGTQMEKGMLPVVRKLGNNIDFELKFVNYAMHPTQGEVEEQLNQYCIQRDYNDKYLTYLGKFLEAGDGEDALSYVGLSKSDISKCVEETDNKFDVIKNLNDKSSWASGRFPQFMIHDEDNKKYGVRGSPTLIINGKQAQSGRDAQSILNTICETFTNKPEVCSTDMSSFGIPAPGFGFDTQGGSATTAGCGA